jgi:branched-chain amino acid transport system permease protein
LATATSQESVPPVSETNRGKRGWFSRINWISVVGLVVVLAMLARIGLVLSDPERAFPLPLWGLQLGNGLILGGVYALIALGYTLVYGILFMINFAHGEVMMFGAYAGFFTLMALNSTGVLEANPYLAVAIVFGAGMIVSMLTGITLERIAYRPLRAAPRLVPLITAIGASVFMQEASRLIFGAPIRVYLKPEFLQGVVQVGQTGVNIPRTGIFVILASLFLMIVLYYLVKRTATGRAMRAVATNKEMAALMGVSVDRIIVITFAIGSVLAGAAGVMLGFHNNQISSAMGFVPGIKAFTAAVLGGIGNIPGAMLGGFILGLAEALGPTLLDIPSQYKDVIAFSLLVLVLLFRPQGILGEQVSKDKA